MADRTEPEMPQVPADDLKAAGPPDTEALSTPQISAPMLDVHAPHQTVHTWKDFLVHIAAISIGLLIALGLEATVQWVHHKHQAQQALELLKQEIDRNRIAVKNDMRSGDIGERDHRAALAVLHRLRSGTLRPDDRLIFIRKFNPLGSTAWRVVHESGAAAYIPYEQMAKYGELYDAQQRINDGAMSVYADLQRATAVLNAETEDQSRDEEDRIQNEAENADAQLALRSPDSRSEAAENAINIRLSGNPDLRRLTPAQIDRLEQGFQQAITDDRRLHRNYVNLEALYAALAK
jgi:hypothetical protein